MSPIWKIRAFRLWLLLYVPAALFFGYYALSSAIEISTGRKAVAEWLKIEQQKVTRGERKAIEPVDIQFEMLKTDFDRHYEHRNLSLAFLVAGLAIPGFSILVRGVLRWVWANRSLQGPVEKSSDSVETARVCTYLRWYKWASAAASIPIVGLVLAPESLAKATIAALVQGLVFVMAAWLFMRVKEWWSWRKPQ